MAQEARISSRIDKNLKIQGDAVLASLGLKPSQAMSMFYAQLVLHGGLPFDVKIPNAETLAALNEDLSAATRFDTVSDLMRDLDAEDTEECAR